VPYVELDRSDWENTGRLLSSPKIRALRIPLSDGLIAQLCIRHALSLLTLDKHFEMFEHVMRAGLR
jgi:predicted nucleic acid-binding protein